MNTHIHKTAKCYETDSEGALLVTDRFAIFNARSTAKVTHQGETQVIRSQAKSDSLFMTRVSLLRKRLWGWERKGGRGEGGWRVDK